MTKSRPMANRTMFAAVLTAGLIVGTLDILAAVVTTLLRGGNPLMMLRFIASGIFGAQAFSGGWPYAMSGLFFHYCIAMIWAIIFFLLAKRIVVLRQYWIVAGICYGILVWLVMNVIVLPLSHTPPLPFNVNSAIIGTLILIVAIGMPLAFFSYRYFGDKNTSVD